MNKKTTKKATQDPSTARKVGRGIMNALLPMQAVGRVKDSGLSLLRIGQMLKTGKLVPKHEPTESDLLERAEMEEGRALIRDLPAKERYEYLAEGTDTTEAVRHQNMVALRRSHTIRLVLMYFTLLMMPGIFLKFGIASGIYCLTVVIFLSVSTLRSACFFIQLREKALWSLAQLRARPNLWLLKTAFWFLPEVDDVA